MKRPPIQAIVAPIVFILSVVAYGTWYSIVESKSVAVSGLQSQINIKKETIGRASSARVALAEIAGDEAVVQSYFVPETGIVSFIDEIEEVGRLQKANVSVLSVSKENAESNPTLMLSVSVVGTFDSVMRTVGSIEYAPYSLFVPSLSINKDDKNVWHADMKILVGSVNTTP